MMGGQSTHLPLKVNAGGVIPIIFASSLLALPQTFLQFPVVKNNAWLSSMLGALGGAEPLYYVAVRCSDRLFLLLLHFDHFQSDGSGGQHAQVRRVYSGHSSGKEHGRVHG